MQTTIDSGRAKGLSGFARDFSFRLLKYFEANAEKWFELYVVSASKTEVHIATGSASPQRSFAARDFEGVEIDERMDRVGRLCALALALRELALEENHDLARCGRPYTSDESYRPSEEGLSIAARE